MNNDSGETGIWDPIEGIRETVKSHDDDNCGDDASQWRTDTRFRFQCGPREGTSGWISTKTRSNSVCYADGNELLVGIDFIAI